MKRPSIATIAAAPLLAITTLSTTPVPAQLQLHAQLAQSPPTVSDVSQLDMSAKPSLNQEQVRRVQQALQKKGISPGPIDGIIGPLTMDAVRKFQDRFGIGASGEINNQTLFALDEADLAAQSGG
jgi:peptidoglycan hydrolase-like protein with peptidoglycan-binding domain